MCKIQYVEKSDTFNIRLSNHRKDINKLNAIEAGKHFNNNDLKFSKNGKFIITEQQYKHCSDQNTKIKIERKKKKFDHGT